MSWEIVGWGVPGIGDAVTRREGVTDNHVRDDAFWYNMEAGDRAPQDRDIERSTEAVIKVTDNYGSSKYWTIHLDPFHGIEELTEYIDDVWLSQYE